MKRLLSLMILSALLLSGCSGQGQRMKDPVTFYYLRSQFEYGSSQSVMDGEERESSGHRDDLRYLMALYLMGPSGEELRSPLPSGTRILSVEEEASIVTLTLSEMPATMTDAAFSLACACLTKTCMELTQASSVTVISGTRMVTMGPDNLILTDSLDTAETEEPQ